MDLFDVEFERICAFHSYEGEIFTYHLRDNERLHTFRITCDDNCKSVEAVEKLINKNDIYYFEYEVKDEISNTILGSQYWLFDIDFDNEV